MTGRASAPSEAQLSFSSTHYAARMAFDAYHAIFAPGADVVREDAPFEAHLTSHGFARMVIHERLLHNVRHIRDRAQVLRNDFSHFTLTFCLAGSIDGRSEDHCIRVRPGQMLMSDMRRPVTLRMTDAHILTVSVAREVIEAAAGNADRFHTRLFPEPEAAALRDDLIALVRRRPGPRPDTTLPLHIVSHHLEGMLRADANSAVKRRRGTRLLLAHQVIEDRLDDPSLDVDAIAKQVGVSRATLYRAFADIGGVERHLVMRRLERSRQLLTTSGQRTSFAAIADRTGWSSESHASRLFFERFGVRPAAYRNRMLALSDAARAAFLQEIWTRDLR